MNSAEANTQFSTKTALVTRANSGLGFEGTKAALAERVGMDHMNTVYIEPRREK